MSPWEPFRYGQPSRLRDRRLHDCGARLSYQFDPLVKEPKAYQLLLANGVSAVDILVPQ